MSTTDKNTKTMTSGATLKRLMKYLKHYWFFLIVSLLMALISVALTLYLPILIGDAIDLIVGPGQVDFPGIARLVGIMAVCIGIRTGTVDHECLQ